MTSIYFKLISDVMGHKSAHGRSQALRRNAGAVLKDKKFDEFKTNIGIVATSLVLEKPMIFKSSVAQAHGLKSTFVPGFGCTITDALMASTAAFPFFKRQHVDTVNQRRQEVIDGGFVANNPTLFAIADAAVHAYKIPKEQIKVLSIGVGIYNEPRRNLIVRFVLGLWPFYLTLKIP